VDVLAARGPRQGRAVVHTLVHDANADVSTDLSTDAGCCR